MHNALDLVDAPAPTCVVRAPTQGGAAHAQLSVPCVYCRGSIPASTFAFWSNARLLMSATCPKCDRRVTLATSTWRRWLRSSAA